MAHGGHHSSSHHIHHHSRSSYSSGGSNWMTIVLIIAAIIILFLTMASNDISGKKPLEEKFEVSQYLYDESNYFSNPKEIVEGLQYLYEKTNVQVVVMSTSSSCSDSRAVELYYELFSDEGHVLIVVPTAWYSSKTYYAIGDVANNVIDDRAMNYLINRINSSNSGKKWKECLIGFADKLIDE